jgi:aminopeptidase N
MLTLITGHRSLKSLVGVSVHEVIHSWYQLLLGTNESKYSWMDEGFTSFASDVIMDSIFGAGSSTHTGAYAGYYNLVKSGMAEPMTSHADYYKTNRAYGINSYSKGEVLLNQLNYIMGSDLFYKGMRDYYYTWRYKHPTPTEFKRVMEKASGLELDWYFENWVGTINTIDYGIKSVVSSSSKTELIIERVGDMPMPVDLVVTLNDNSTINYQIPLEIMRGEKSAKEGYSELKTELAWPWVYPTYKLVLDEKFTDIKSIEIDPSNRMADVDRGNNLYPSKASTTFPFK